MGSIIFDLMPYLTCGGILLTRHCLDSKRNINLLNVYGPCLEGKIFQERLEFAGLLSMKYLVLAIDLNLTLSVGEIWGSLATLGSLATFFTNLFNRNTLIDIQPGSLAPT